MVRSVGEALRVVDGGDEVGELRDLQAHLQSAPPPRRARSCALRNRPTRGPATSRGARPRGRHRRRPAGRARDQARPAGGVPGRAAVAPRGDGAATPRRVRPRGRGGGDDPHHRHHRHHRPRLRLLASSNPTARQQVRAAQAFAAITAPLASSPTSPRTRCASSCSRGVCWSQPVSLSHGLPRNLLPPLQGDRRHADPKAAGRGPGRVAIPPE